MYMRALFFWPITEPAHIASAVLHLELCLHSHSFHAAHSSWTGREWLLLPGPVRWEDASSPRAPGPELGPSALCWGGLHRCARHDRTRCGIRGPGQVGPIPGEIGFYRGLLWSGWLDGGLRPSCEVFCSQPRLLPGQLCLIVFS